MTNLVEVLRGAREAVMRHGLSDPEYYDAGVAALCEWIQRPDAALRYGINWAEATRRSTQVPGEQRSVEC